MDEFGKEILTFDKGLEDDEIVVGPYPVFLSGERKVVASVVAACG